MSKTTIFPPSTGIWGRHQTCDLLAPGVVLVTTASHGGVVVQAEAARKFLTVKAVECCGQSGWGLLWFEEDCAVGVLMYEHPEWFVRYYNTFNPAMTVQKIKESGEASLRRHYPEYSA